ncbi:unnamed protein product [Paramecium sonneborni]|uniref:non-specific serine/threonine protein kinase n=1 Tax=Paramecium sonneborni TaxID=65129 RepID=A0A8S1KPG3_9CILI|nr:unnamed protein product [Paramecium sonneborni]
MLQKFQTQIEKNLALDNYFEEMEIGRDYYKFIMIKESHSMAIYKCIRRQSEQDYIVYRIPYKRISKTQSLQLSIPYQIEKLNQIRLANIIHPENIYYEQNYTYMTQSTYLNNFQLLNQRNTLHEQKQLFIITQLCITLQELQKRNFPPYILNLNNIYIIENVLHLSFLHFKFDEIGSCDFESFQQFVHKYFSIANKYCINNYESTTDKLIEILKLDYFDQGCPHLNYVKILFQIENIESKLRGCNSFTFSTKKPALFSIYPQAKNHIFIKVPRIMDDNLEVIEYRQLQNQRELQFNEQLQNSSKFATFLSYLRIQKHLFFFYQEYPLTLDQLFEDSNQKILLKKLQYKFAMQLAMALSELHKKQILHRDIKPQNIFLTSVDIEKANIKLADFDRSRRIKTEQIYEQKDFYLEDSSEENTIFSSTYNYNPPESFGTIYDFSSDIWQFGLTLFQMANNGIYPPVKKAMLFDPEEYSNINLNLISSVLNQELKEQTLHQDYIILISRCLESQSDKRISLNDFISNLKNIRINIKDQDDVIIPDDYYDYSDQSTGSFDQAICWQKFQKFSRPKIPNCNLRQLNQLSGDTLQFLKDQLLNI